LGYRGDGDCACAIAHGQFHGCVDQLLTPEFSMCGQIGGLNLGHGLIFPRLGGICITSRLSGSSLICSSQLGHSEAMKRHLAILAFGVLVAGSVTYAQIAPQAISKSTSLAQSATASATATNISSSIAKPSIAGGGESDD